MFLIMHEYDADNGVEVSIHEDIIGCVETEDEAKAFVEKFNKPEPYYNKYGKKILYRHTVFYKPMPPKLDLDAFNWQLVDNNFS